jgi:membrane-associated phospholipid phosphatase
VGSKISLPAASDVSARSAATRYGLLGLGAFAAFVLLGNFVVARGEPMLFQAWMRALLDHSTLVAWWITWACYPSVLVPVCLVVLIVAWRVPQWRTRALLSIALLLLCWRAADLFQSDFLRVRPQPMFYKQETSGSYPSSHAAIATGFYALWGLLLYLSDLPKGIRIGGAASVALFAVAICWSRLALGAHYVTDLIGGALLAISIVSATAAFAPSAFLEPVAGRLSGAAE